MEALLGKVLREGVPLTEQEEGLRALAFFLGQGPPAPGHVSLVQEIFAKNLVFSPKYVSVADELASREELTELTVALVQALAHGQAQHGGALAQHSVAAPFTALVMRTLLERLPSERSHALSVAYLNCLGALWDVVPTETAVGFLPGTVAELSKILTKSHDKRVPRKVVEMTLDLLGTAVVLTCSDSDTSRTLRDIEGDTHPGAAYGMSPAEVMARLLGTAPKVTGDDAPQLRVRKESEALNVVVRDEAWVRTARGKLCQTLTSLFASVAECSSKGTVHADGHPHLHAFAALGCRLLAACSHFLRPALPLLVEVAFLSQQSRGEDEPLDSVAAGCAAAYSKEGAGQALRLRLEALVVEIPRKPHQALAVSGWVHNVLRGETLPELVLIGDSFLASLLRATVRAVCAVGSSDFNAYTKQHGSVLGALHELSRSLATHVPLQALFGVLLADLRDFSLWRLHHSVLWVLKTIVRHSHRNAFIASAEELCDALAAVVSGFTDTPEQWYFDDKGVGIAAVTHCTALCRLMLECIADASTSLFSYDNGAARHIRARDKFLIKTVFAVLEKVPSPHTEVASCAQGVLSVLAGTCYGTPPSRAAVARLLIDTFDWIVDAVVARLPFLADYPDTPKMLAAAMELLEGALDEAGASEPLLTLLHHVLHDVTSTLLALERRLSTDSGVFTMLGSIAGLLSRSVRLKQGLLATHSLYGQGAATALLTVAAGIAAAHVTGVPPPAEDGEPTGPTGNEPEPCSEEALWCKQERALALDVVAKVQHQVTSAHVAHHRVLCDAVRACVLLFCTFDGVSDRLQSGRRTDAPVAEVRGGVVVDLVAAWYARAAGAEGASLAAPVYRGGVGSQALHPVHCLWSPLIARLIPRGFSHPDEMALRLTQQHVLHYCSTSVHTRLRKWHLPVVDIGSCASHVVQVALVLVVYVRDFVEDRMRKELWPLLRYHLVLSPHLFHEFAGGRPEYIASTPLYRFQLSCLLWLLVLFPESLRDSVLEARMSPDLHQFSPNNDAALSPLFDDIVKVTTRFSDPRQPPQLRRACSELHARLALVLAQRTAPPGEAAPETLAPPTGGVLDESPETDARPAADEAAVAAIGGGGLPRQGELA